MRVYYLNQEYEPNKHRVAHVYSEYVHRIMPEDSPRSIPNVPYSVIEFDERYNRVLARNLLRNRRGAAEDGTPLPNRYYVNDAGEIVSNDTGEIQTINPNPQKESYKLCQLYGLTHEQARNYIDSEMNSITNLAEARTIIGELFKKVADIELWLVKQARLDEEG